MKRTINATICSKNILKAYKQCTSEDIEAGNFYRDAYDFCLLNANKYGKTVEQVAGITAVLSPGANWLQNKVDTVKFLKGVRSGFTTYPAFLPKAIAINNLTGGSASDSAIIFDLVYGKQGQKTASFFLNMTGNLAVVTVDRHAYRVAMGEKGAGSIRVTVKQYETIQAAYTIAANKLRIAPCVLQAITWAWFKRVNNRGNITITEETTSEDAPF